MKKSADTGWTERIVLTLIALACVTAWSHAATIVVDQRHPAAADTNSGTREAPLKTVSAAAARAAAGDEVLVRPGIYREAVTLTNSGALGKPIVFRSEVPRAAVISGADVVSNWQNEAAGVWSFPVAKTWEVAFLGGNPQWVYMNGLPLERAETRDRLIPGTFFHDVKGCRALVSPPEGVSLATGMLEYAFRDGLICPTGTLNDIHISGFTLRHNANWFRGRGPIVVMGQRWLVEGNHIQWTSYGGLETQRSAGCVVRSNLIEWAGCQGIGGGRNVDLLVEGNTVRYNNWRMFNWGNEGGGSKWSSTLDSRIRNNEFAYNFGPGIWFDGGNGGNIYERNLCHDNAVRALFAEISWDELIQDNIVYNTGESGILSSSSPGVVIRRNVLFNNGIGVGLGGDYTRGNDHEQKWYPHAMRNMMAALPGLDPQRLVRWEAAFLKYYVAPKFCILNNCVVWDNLIFDNGLGIMEGRDYRQPSPIAGFVNNFSDYNLFWAARSNELFGVGYQSRYENLAVWQKASDRDQHSVFANPRDPATRLPEWAAARRAEWDLRMRPIQEPRALGAVLPQSPMAQIAIGRILRSPQAKALKLRDDRVKGILFEMEGRRALGLWTTQVAERRYLRLRLDQPTVTVENGYLHREERRLPNGCVDMLITYNPTYLLGIGTNVVEAPSGVLQAQAFNLANHPVPASVVFANDGMEAVKLSAAFTPSAGFTVVPATIARQLAPGERLETRLALTPDGSARKGTGMLRMAATVGAESISRVAVFTIGEGENTLPAAPRPPTIDGRLEDWGERVASRVPLAMIGDASQCLAGDTNAWKGPADLSARLYGAWTTQALYLAVAVTDDRVLPGTPGGAAAGGDSIAISLDGRAPDMQWQQALTRGCYHAVIRPLANGQAQVTPSWQCQGIRDVTAAAALSPSGYVVEMMIPLTAANFPASQWEPGRPVKLSLLIFDADDSSPDAKRKVMGWSVSPNQKNDENTSGWSTVILEK